MIGIVGNGFVGNAVYQNFRDKTICKVYDVDKNRSLNTLGEVINCDFIFVCLPTPMKENGECDLTIIDGFFENLPECISATFVIKDANVFVISHKTELHDKFNSVIKFDKIKGFSRIVS